MAGISPGFVHLSGNQGPAPPGPGPQPDFPRFQEQARPTPPPPPPMGQGPRQPPPHAPAMGWNAGNNQGAPGARSERRVEVFDVRSENLTQADAREKLSSFTLVIVRQADVSNEVDEEGYPLVPSWNKASHDIEDISKQDATRKVRKLMERTASVEKKRRELDENLRTQLDRTKIKIEKTETDPRFQYSIAQFDIKTLKKDDTASGSKQKKSDYSKKKHRRTRSNSSTRKNKSRGKNDKDRSKSSKRKPKILLLKVYLKRSPRSQEDCLRMLREQSFGHPAHVPTARPPPSQPPMMPGQHQPQMIPQGHPAPMPQAQGPPHGGPQIPGQGPPQMMPQGHPAPMPQAQGPSHGAPHIPGQQGNAPMQHNQAPRPDYPQGQPRPQQNGQRPPPNQAPRPDYPQGQPRPQQNGQHPPPNQAPRPDYPQGQPRPRQNGQHPPPRTVYVNQPGHPAPGAHPQSQPPPRAAPAVSKAEKRHSSDNKGKNRQPTPVSTNSSMGTSAYDSDSFASDSDSDEGISTPLSSDFSERDHGKHRRRSRSRSRTRPEHYGTTRRHHVRPGGMPSPQPRRRLGGMHYLDERSSRDFSRDRESDPGDLDRLEFRDRLRDDYLREDRERYLGSRRRGGRYFDDDEDWDRASPRRWAPRDVPDYMTTGRGSHLSRGSRGGRGSTYERNGLYRR